MFDRQCAGPASASRAEPMPPGEFEGHWRRVVLEVDSGEVQSVERLEGVVVDEAQLLLADLDGLGPNGVAMETTWGDGIFPVVVHYGGRVTVEL